MCFNVHSFLITVQSRRGQRSRLVVVERGRFGRNGRVPGRREETRRRQSPQQMPEEQEPHQRHRQGRRPPAGGWRGRNEPRRCQTSPRRRSGSRRRRGDPGGTGSGTVDHFSYNSLLLQQLAQQHRHQLYGEDDSPIRSSDGQLPQLGGIGSRTPWTRASTCPRWASSSPPAAAARRSRRRTRWLGAEAATRRPVRRKEQPPPPPRVEV